MVSRLQVILRSTYCSLNYRSCSHKILLLWGRSSIPFRALVCRTRLLACSLAVDRYAPLLVDLLDPDLAGRGKPPPLNHGNILDGMDFGQQRGRTPKPHRQPGDKESRGISCLSKISREKKHNHAAYMHNPQAGTPSWKASFLSSPALF